MSTSMPIASRRNLTLEQRSLLQSLIEADPLATCRGIAARFGRLTGRAISVPTVRRAWMGDYRDPAANRNRPLTEAERATLERICRESAPTFNRSRIVRRFEAESGRSIHRKTVVQFLGRTLGIAVPPSPHGRPPGRSVTA